VGSQTDGFDASNTMAPLKLLGDAAVASYTSSKSVVINVALTLGLTWNARAACTHAYLTFVYIIATSL
jgi:hypothetical protein